MKPDKSNDIILFTNLMENVFTNKTKFKQIEVTQQYLD